MSDRFVKRLDRIVLNPSNDCNFKCKMCDVWMARGKTLDFPVIKQALKDAHKIGARSLYLSGGEPLLYQDLIGVLRVAKKLRYSVMLTTNGSLIDVRMARRIASYVDSVGVSVEGNQESNDALRGRGSFEVAVKGIKHLKKYGVNVGMAMVVTRGSYSFMKDLVVKASELGLCWVHFQPFSKRLLFKRGKDVSRFAISPKGLAGLRHSINEARKTARKFNITIANGQYMLRAIPFYFAKNEHVFPKDGCSIPFHSLAVAPDGSVSGCFPMARLSLGNINKDSIAAMWNSPESDLMRLMASRNLCLGCLNGCSEIAVY